MKEVLLTSSVLILALLILRQVFWKKISRRAQYALWGLVLLRLLVPASLPALSKKRPRKTRQLPRNRLRNFPTLTLSRWKLRYPRRMRMAPNGA